MSILLLTDLRVTHLPQLNDKCYRRKVNSHSRSEKVTAKSRRRTKFLQYKQTKAIYALDEP